MQPSSTSLFDEQYTTFRFRCQSRVHGVSRWSSTSLLFRSTPSPKRFAPCQPASPGTEALPAFPSRRCPDHPPARREDPSGHFAGVTNRAVGARPKPFGRRNSPSLHHCSPPFIMMRSSFDGCLRRSSRTSPVVFSGLRAQTHIPSVRATIMAAMTFVSHRCVSASS